MSVMHKAKGIRHMPKSDHDFINCTDLSQQYELEDWLAKRNGYSSSQSNVDKLKKIINDKLKEGDTAKNVKWIELDAAKKKNPEWFTDLDKLVHRT